MQMFWLQICEQQLDGGWTVVFDQEQQVPYAYKGDQWIGYDNPQSVGLKVQFAKSYNLGGVMIWSVETDDFRGICGSKYPILNAIKSALQQVLEILSMKQYMLDFVLHGFFCRHRVAKLVLQQLAKRQLQLQLQLLRLQHQQLKLQLLLLRPPQLQLKLLLLLLLVQAVIHVLQKAILWIRQTATSSTIVHFTVLNT